MTKTIQLRRYQLVEGEYDAFVEWFHERMAPLRPQMGYTIEFAYGLPESNEFVWAVSAPVDRETFVEMDAKYVVSPERAAAFDGVPQRVESTSIAFVNDLT